MTYHIRPFSGGLYGEGDVRFAVMAQQTLSPQMKKVDPARASYAAQQAANLAIRQTADEGAAVNEMLAARLRSSLPGTGLQPIPGGLAPAEPNQIKARVNAAVASADNQSTPSIPPGVVTVPLFPAGGNGSSLQQPTQTQIPWQRVFVGGAIVLGVLVAVSLFRR